MFGSAVLGLFNVLYAVLQMWEHVVLVICEMTILTIAHPSDKETSKSIVLEPVTVQVYICKQHFDFC